MDNNNRIDYIEFPAPDVAAAKTFYGAVFGWNFEDWGPGYASFHDGRIAGGFNAEAEPRPGGTLVVLYSTALESAVERVTGAGGEILKPIFAFPGGRRFHFADPAGNELAI